MNNPGSHVLFAGAIGAALAAQAQTAITDLEGMLGVTLIAQLLGGTAGTSIVALVQTSLDGGATWFDVARFDFANTAGVKYANLSGTVSKAIIAYAALAAEGVNDGLVGDQFRAVITSVGTYTNTTLSVRIEAR
ncbi:hypothetical protein [Mesorhizobium sp. M0520]|uniref:hypothetical protein n=1 Tax=Mesorhizobium sp. M0520 TaxID=2956957 RepID=UPI0033352C72